MSGLQIDCPLVTEILTGFLRDEITKFGVQRGVVGMSGGIDSTLSAFLAVHALGRENVLGLMMPYSTSSPESEGHARMAADQLGIEARVIDITPQIDAYFERFPDASRLRRANKMARERMTILYDHSVAESAMVIGTSNKTEALLGYTTLWGDMASAVNPIGDLYKTQVRQLSRYLGVPAPIIDKPPTADLWLGQTDEGELGFSYEDVDRLLYDMVDLRRPRAELIGAGFPETFVDRVHLMVRNSQYKRRIPLIAKVSHRSIDRDFRYSRDWGH
jgi:NAD+ synthase